MSRTSFTLSVLLAVVALTGGARPSAAQRPETDLPPSGTKVRLTLERWLEGYRGDREPKPRLVVGTLLAVDSDSVVLRRTREREMRPVDAWPPGR